MCLTAKICKKKSSISPNRMERPHIMKTGWGRGTTERGRERDGQKERERKREEDAMRIKALSIDVENVETTGERCCHLS